MLEEGMRISKFGRLFAADPENLPTVARDYLQCIVFRVEKKFVPK